MKEYNVYAKHMRDAQICTVELNDTTEENKWMDVSQDLLLDVVYATDPDSAIKKVAEDWSISENALYATEHVSSSIAMVKDSDGLKHQARFEAFGFSEEDREGIEVILPDGRTLKVYIQDEQGLKCSIVEDAEWKDIPLDEAAVIDKQQELIVKTPKGTISAKIMKDKEYPGIATLTDAPGEPGVIVEYDPNRHCIVGRVYSAADPDGDPAAIVNF